MTVPKNDSKAKKYMLIRRNRSNYGEFSLVREMKRARSI